MALSPHANFTSSIKRNNDIFPIITIAGSSTLYISTRDVTVDSQAYDGRLLNKGTAYLTDAGMCGDYNSVIGMNSENSIKRFYKEESIKNFPAEGEASLCGAIVEADPKNGLATKITQFITGGQLKKDQ